MPSGSAPFAPRTHGPHARTPENIASLMLGLETFLDFATEIGALTPDESAHHNQEAQCEMARLAEAQATFLSSETPADRFVSLVRTAISSGRCHVCDEYGTDPLSAEALGWRRVTMKDAEFWQPQGRTIGWIKDMDLYLDPEATYATVQELARTRNQAFPLGQNVLWKRLDETTSFRIP